MKGGDAGKRPRVCFVSLYAWPLFDPDCRGAFGGSEVRIAALARGLAQRGNVEVNFVVFDHGQGRRTFRDDIAFHAWPDPAPDLVTVSSPAPASGQVQRPIADQPSKYAVAGVIRRAYARGGMGRVVAWAPYQLLQSVRAALHGISVSRYAVIAAVHRLQARLGAAATIGRYIVAPSRFALLDAIAPDVVVVHGATSVTAEMVAWCVARGRPAIFVAGSDDDFLRQHLEHPEQPTAYGDAGGVVSYGVAKAAVHVVQTPAQAQRLHAVYGRSGTLLRNPIDLALRFPRDDDGTVLWVGKSDAIKRPDLAIEIARRVPSARFLLVMNPSDPDLHRRVEMDAAALGNVRVERAVPFDEIESRFARASVFLNTSRVEGFPNTFLQAAKYGVPIASLDVDPAGMLEGGGAGVFGGGDVDRLAREIADLLTSADRRGAMGMRALAYVREHHDRERIVEQLEQTLLTAARSPRAAT